MATREPIQDLGRVKGIEGQWVVVHKKRVVASNSDVRLMLKEARKYPDDEVYVTKVLYPNASFY